MNIPICSEASLAAYGRERRARRDRDLARRVQETLMCAPPPSWTGGVLPYVGGPPANPGPPVTGYALWLDATNPANTNTTWIDKSGNGNNATASGLVADQPTLVANAIGGLTAYSFPGTSSEPGSAPMATVNFATTSSFTVFGVATILSTANTFSGIINNAYPNYYDLSASQSLGPFWSVQAHGLNNNGLGTATGTGTPYVYCGCYSLATSTLTFYINNVLNTVGSNTPTYTFSGTTNPSPRTIGASGVVGSELLIGYIGEIIEYQTALTPTQISNVNTYLMTKWTA
jgi:hypothetical protein